MPTSHGQVLILLFALVPITGIAGEGNATTHEKFLFRSIIELFENNFNYITTGDSNITQNESPFVNATALSNSSATRLLINEVELNPAGNDVGSEWIELYNPSDRNVTIGDFGFNTSRSITVHLPDGIAIGPGQTLVITLAGEILSNIAEILVMTNLTSGNFSDETPWLVDAVDDDRTWQRMPDGNEEWQFVSNTRGGLNDPSVRAQSNVSDTDLAQVQCFGSAGCAQGIVVRIADGDTLYVLVNSTIYKIDLALAHTPSGTEEGFIESTAFTRDLCLGGEVTVDQDDIQPTLNGTLLAAVYCSSDSLNEELLDSGYATIDLEECTRSEFGTHGWATEHGC